MTWEVYGRAHRRDGTLGAWMSVSGSLTFGDALKLVVDIETGGSGIAWDWAETAIVPAGQKPDGPNRYGRRAVTIRDGEPEPRDDERVCVVTVKPDIYEMLAAPAPEESHVATTRSLGRFSVAVCSCGWETAPCVGDQGAMVSWHAHRRREERV